MGYTKFIFLWFYFLSFSMRKWLGRELMVNCKTSLRWNKFVFTPLRYLIVGSKRSSRTARRTWYRKKPKKKNCPICGARTITTTTAVVDDLPGWAAPWSLYTCRRVKRRGDTGRVWRRPRETMARHQRKTASATDGPEASSRDGNDRVSRTRGRIIQIGRPAAVSVLSKIFTGRYRKLIRSYVGYYYYEIIIIVVRAGARWTTDYAAVMCGTGRRGVWRCGGDARASSVELETREGLRRRGKKTDLLAKPHQTGFYAAASTTAPDGGETRERVLPRTTTTGIRQRPVLFVIPTFLTLIPSAWNGRDSERPTPLAGSEGGGKITWTTNPRRPPRGFATIP